MRRKTKAAILALILVILSVTPAFALQYGDSGDDVKALQELLVEKGLLSDTPDGVFGANTEKAVMAFQERIGVTPNGLVSDDLIKQIEASEKVEIEEETEAQTEEAEVLTEEETEEQTQEPEEQTGETETLTEEALTEEALTEEALSEEIETADDADFVIDDYDGILLGYTGAGGDVTVPSYIGEIPVLAADDQAFSGDPDITSLSLPQPLDRLLAGAVRDMDGLESISLPDTLTVIGPDNFANCPHLKEVTVPARVTIVQSGSFSACAELGSITFLGDVPVFESACFSDLSESAVIVVPEDRIREYRSALPEDITVKGSGKDAVICDYSVPDDAFAFDADTGTITAYTGFDKRVDIPSEIGGARVTAIGDEAFADNRYLTYVTLPEGIRTVGKDAFSYMSSLAYVEMPASLQTIGENAFYGYRGQTAGFREGLEEIGGGAFALSALSGDLHLPSTVRVIGDSAFERSSVRSLYLGGSLERIGSKAFAIPSLGYVQLDEFAPVDIAEDAFLGDDALTDLDLPWYCTEEVREAYRGLMEEQAPECYVWINNPPAEYPKDDTCVFERNGDGTFRLSYYSGSQPILQLWHAWYDEETQDYVPITGVGDGAFKGSETLKGFYVTHSDMFTTIGDEAFADSSLEHIDLFNTTETIGSGAFRNCTNLKEITLPKSLTYVAEDAFEGCTGLETVSILCDPSVIPENAFDTCTALKNKQMP